jgi:hypothetical protein
MSRPTTTIAAALLGASLAFAIIEPAAAQAAKGNCVNKAGEGTNTTKAGAEFQAYEAILQATDWGMWASWMAGSQKVGEAPGYKVSNVRSKCSPGGLGQTCRIQATLCK